MTDDFMQSPEFQALIKEYLEYLNTSLPGVRINLSDALFQDVPVLRFASSRFVTQQVHK